MLSQGFMSVFYLYNAECAFAIGVSIQYVVETSMDSLHELNENPWQLPQVQCSMSVTKQRNF